jgi:hypothetical protein
MVFTFAIVSPALPDGTPASDLNGEAWSFQDSTIESATGRAQRRLTSTFALASADRRAATSIRYLGQFTSLSAFRAAESGETMRRSA